jgi:hypothetical protein
VAVSHSQLARMVHHCYREVLPTAVGEDPFAGAECLALERLNRYLPVLHSAKEEWPVRVEVFGCHCRSCCLVLVVEEEEPEKTLRGMGRVDEEVGVGFCDRGKLRTHWSVVLFALCMYGDKERSKALTEVTRQGVACTDSAASTRSP